ncbi:hypothetical protein [Candidatus Hodgkinia cicadicola]|uniref:hypothetical protein n=1 Tax=Candidatus Hodgkinia cicadicola TaxID=573658 RepID=UPI0011BADB48
MTIGGTSWVFDRLSWIMIGDKRSIKRLVLLISYLIRINCIHHDQVINETWMECDGMRSVNCFVNSQRSCPKYWD